VALSHRSLEMRQAACSSCAGGAVAATSDATVQSISTPRIRATPLPQRCLRGYRADTRLTNGSAHGRLGGSCGERVPKPTRSPQELNAAPAWSLRDSRMRRAYEPTNSQARDAMTLRHYNTTGSRAQPRGVADNCTGLAMSTLHLCSRWQRSVRRADHSGSRVPRDRNTGERHGNAAGRHAHPERTHRHTTHHALEALCAPP
jgi:hypothetical protein